MFIREEKTYAKLFLQLFMEFYVILFLSLHNLECIAGRFLIALQRHTRVVETCVVAKRDHKRKRAPFAKGLERKESSFSPFDIPKTARYASCAQLY